MDESGIFETRTFDSLSPDELYGILKSRSEVFLLEQGIVCQDLDDVDRSAVHVFSVSGGRIIAYLRVYGQDGTVRIGRVLVVRNERGRGLGRKLMESGIRAAHKYYPQCPVKLHSQEQVCGFYSRLGFCKCSDRFMEEGIPHFEMVLKE